MMFKKMVSFFLVALMLTSAALAANFTDFTADHWAYPYVNELVASGVINGYEDGTYRPEANVTRAELAKLISVEFGETAAKTYTDVAQTDWFYPYVTGSGGYFLAEGEFRPNGQATREEVAYAIYIAKGLAQTAQEAAFTDSGDIAFEYRSAVASVADSGIITGYPDGSFAPKNNITRAEVATVLSRAINLGGDDELYRTVYRMSRLMDTPYQANETITYGQLSAAALRMYNNEYNLAYYNLGDVVGKRPFTHEYSLAFWLIGRDVLGGEVVTQETIDTPISVQEAMDVMVYYAQKHDFAERTVDTSVLLNHVGKNRPLTHKIFARLITELDQQIPLTTKVVLSGDNTADMPATAIRADLSTYPASAANYQIILEEIPNAVYDAAYPAGYGKPSTSYDFAREMKSFFLKPINQFCQIAQENGAKIKIHYYPSLCAAKDDVYILRVKMDIVSVSSGVDNLNDIVNTTLSRNIKAGDSFFLEINSHAKIPSTGINGGVLTVDKIFE